MTFMLIALPAANTGSYAPPVSPDAPRRVLQCGDEVQREAPEEPRRRSQRA